MKWVVSDSPARALVGTHYNTPGPSSARSREGVQSLADRLLVLLDVQDAVESPPDKEAQ